MTMIDRSSRTRQSLSNTRQGPPSSRGAVLSSLVVGVLVAGVALARTASAQDHPRPTGVTPEIERSIKRGLNFLARTQNRDGSWRGSGGYGVYPCSMTSLALTALLASGSTSTRGRYSRQVRRATDFLISLSQPSGVIRIMSSIWKEPRLSA